MKKYSKNSKLNNVLTEIELQLLSISDTPGESISEIKRYMKEFNSYPDYMLYEYGNVLIYNYDIRNLYKDYKSLTSYSINKIIDIYKRQVGYVARCLTSENK